METGGANWNAITIQTTKTIEEEHGVEMADKHPINPPAQPNKDPTGTSRQRSTEQKQTHEAIKKDATDNNDPEGTR